MVRSLAFVCALATAVTICGISYAGDNANQISASEVQQGKAIAARPVKSCGEIASASLYGKLYC
jgi:hypothetical protein